MKIVPQLKTGHLIRYRRANLEWMEYRVISFRTTDFIYRNTAVSFVMAENINPNVSIEEQYAVFLEYEQQYDDYFVCLKHFRPRLRGLVLSERTRIFVVNATERNETFLLSNHGRWHFLNAENLAERIQYHYDVVPTLTPSPGFYYPKSLVGLPAAVIPQPKPVSDKPVLPVILPRPSLLNLNSELSRPAPIEAPIGVNCYTKPGKITLFELQNRLERFLAEENYKRLNTPPRAYQLEDLKMLFNGAKACEKTVYALVNPAPTGYGKTVFSAMLFSALRVRTLFLVPSNILIAQTVKEFKTMIPEARTVGYESKFTFESVVNNSDVIVTTIQMLQYDGRYKDKFSQAMSAVGYVIFDEAHACISEQRNHIVQMFMQMKCHALGLTATPLVEVYNAFGYFGDGRDNPIPRRSIIENINLGILPGISLSMIDCPTLYAKKSLQTATNSRVIVEQPDNDAMQEDSDEEENLDENRIRNLLADVYFNSADEYTNEYFFGMKAIVFVQRNKDATELAEHFNAIYSANRNHAKINKFEEQFQPGEDFHFAKAVHSDVDDSEQVISEFKANKTRVLIGVKMIAVGFDDKEVQLVFLPTTNSHTHLIQSAGRGARTPSEMMEMQQGQLVNHKTAHFVQLFLGNKKIKYFFNELKVTLNGATTINFNHGVKENNINKITLQEFAKIDTRLDVNYRMRTQPTEVDTSILRKLERTEIHMIGGYPFTREQLDNMPKNLRNILEVLEEQHQIIAIKLKNFANVEVHTEHVVQISARDTSTADTSTKKRVFEEMHSESVVLPRLSAGARNKLIQKLDDVLDRIEEIHTESGQKKGRGQSNGTTALKKKKLELNQLLSLMLAKYKALYQQLVTFENELILQGDAEQFKDNLEKLITEASDLFQPSANAIKNPDLPGFSISNIARYFDCKENINLPYFFSKFSVSTLETSFKQAKAICYVLSRHTRADSIKVLDVVLAKTIERLHSEDQIKNNLTINQIEFLKKTNMSTVDENRLKKQRLLIPNLELNNRVLCQLLSKAIQYLKLDAEVARKLLLQLPVADLFAFPNLHQVAFVLLFTAKIQKIDDLPNWHANETLQALFNQALQLSDQNISFQHMAIAFQYEMFYLLQSWFYPALASNESVGAGLSAKEYISCILSHTLSILELLAILKNQPHTGLAQSVLQDVLSAHRNFYENPFWIHPRKWPEALKFVDAMVENQWVTQPTVFQDFSLNKKISSQELSQTKIESLRQQWLMLPQLAAQLKRHQSLGPYISGYCKERILLLYLYMKNNTLFSGHLEALLIKQLRDDTLSFSITHAVYSASMFRQLFESYLQIDANLSAEKLSAFFEGCLERLSVKAGTSDDLQLLLNFFLKKIAIQPVDHRWSACQLIHSCFIFAPDIAAQGNDFVENSFKPLLVYAANHVQAQSSQVQSETDNPPFERYFGHMRLETTASCVFADKLFALLYSELNNRLSLQKRISLLTGYSASEKSGIGARLVSLQQNLKLAVDVVLSVFFRVWNERTKYRLKFWNSDVLGTLYHYYDTLPGTICSVENVSTKVVYLGCQYRFALREKNKDIKVPPVFLWVSYPALPDHIRIDFLLAILYSNQVLHTILNSCAAGVVQEDFQRLVLLIEVVSQINPSPEFVNFYAAIKSQMQLLINIQFQQYTPEQRPTVFTESMFTALVYMLNQLSQLFYQIGRSWQPGLVCEYPQELGAEVVSHFSLEQLQEPTTRALVFSFMQPLKVSLPSDEKNAQPEKSVQNQDPDAIEEDLPEMVTVPIESTDAVSSTIPGVVLDEDSMSSYSNGFFTEREPHPDCQDDDDNSIYNRFLP